MEKERKAIRWSGLNGGSPVKKLYDGFGEEAGDVGMVEVDAGDGGDPEETLIDLDSFDCTSDKFTLLHRNDVTINTEMMSASGSVLDPLLKDLNEKKQSFRRDQSSG